MKREHLQHRQSPISSEPLGSYVDSQLLVVFVKRASAVDSI